VGHDLFATLARPYLDGDLMTALHLTDIDHLIGDVRLRVDDLVFSAGQLTGIVGPNGAGKTSLLKIAAGLIAPEMGSVALMRGDTYQADRFRDPVQRARHLAYLPQFQPLAWPMACRDVVALGRLPFHGDFGALGAEDWQCVEAAMAQCQVAGFATRPIDQLSGGERARVLMARLMAGQPSVYLLDEPTQSLDPAAQLAVMALMRQQADDGKAVIMVLHDLNLAARFCDRVVVMNHGEPAYIGTPSEVFTQAHLRPIFGVDMQPIDTPQGLVMQAVAVDDERSAP
jgi:ABC-type cobalamin/Fe3+-siderophores transport system ATPase subunit